MNTFIIVLRGVNVGGKNRVKMRLLENALDIPAFENVQTFIQSGNIVLNTRDVDAARAEAIIHETILEHFNLDITVLVRNLPEWEELYENNPFINQGYEDIDKMHVTFLSSFPQQDLKDKVEGMSFMMDEFKIEGKHIYLYCPNGYARSKLTNTFFEKHLEVKTTSRNWKTVSKLRLLAQDVIG
jgi:uncharacterized protein (DUF1697 family)